MFWDWRFLKCSEDSCIKETLRMPFFMGALKHLTYSQTGGSGGLAWFQFLNSCLETFKNIYISKIKCSKSAKYDLTPFLNLFLFCVFISVKIDHKVLLFGRLVWARTCVFAILACNTHSRLSTHLLFCCSSCKIGLCLGCHTGTRDSCTWPKHRQRRDD